MSCLAFAFADVCGTCEGGKVNATTDGHGPEIDPGRTETGSAWIGGSVGERNFVEKIE